MWLNVLLMLEQRKPTEISCHEEPPPLVRDRLATYVPGIVNAGMTAKVSTEKIMMTRVITESCHASTKKHV